MTPRWFLNRLRLMSAGELAYRLQQALRARVERAGLALGWQPEPPGPVATALAVVEREVLQTLAATGYDSAMHSLQGGRLTLFDYPDLPVGWPIDWHRDPLTGIRSPAHQFGKGIDYRDDRAVGDIKVLWELGRQQFLLPLAIQYCLRREQAQLDTIACVIGSWLEQNPYGRGVHWCNSLEVALRGMSWSLCHQFLLAAGVADGLFSLALDRRALQRSLYQHAAFIRGHLSLYSSANNHLIGELTGLHTLCTLFDFGAPGRRWGDFAWRGILREARRQVHPDGVNKEQAIYYHCWVLEYLLINYLLAGHSGRDTPADYVGQLGAMAQFLRDLSPPGAAPPQIGDADDGCALQLQHQPSALYADLLATVSALSAQPAGDHADNAKACAYLALRHSAQQCLAPLRPTRYPACYPEGGYAVLGTPRVHLVFDCGPLGYPAIAAHGHADMLSLCLAIDGHWWLVDPGTYAYHSEQKWRDYFRGSAAHNVLRINRRDQSTSGGPFMWTEHATARFQGVQTRGDCHIVSGWHNGYRRQGVPEVGRSVSVDMAAGRIEVDDELQCDTAAELELHYHFAPDIYCIEHKLGSILMARRGCGTRLLLEFPAAMSLSLHHGDPDTPLGWFSPGLGKKEACMTLRAQTRLLPATGPTGFLTTITIQQV